ncbi:MAG: HpaII family restriction endonuclease [Verrucomicrobiales bacterium]|nr:HpaII family restriction endonuclease [Verrucomicrobiales bacterium]
MNLQFDRVIGATYRNNLLLLDADLSRILSECLFLYYSGEGAQLRKLVTQLEKSNPLQYPDTATFPYYSFKLKKFLLETALGMVPKTPWTGVYDATGGYIIVKKDGELISYHLLRKNYFEDYLLNFTKLDSPSTSRHQYGEIYFENNQAYFNLNLQIRFSDLKTSP